MTSKTAAGDQDPLSLEPDVETFQSYLERARTADRNFRLMLLDSMVQDTVEHLAWVQRGLALLAQEDRAFQAETEAYGMQINDAIYKEEAKRRNIEEFITELRSAFAKFRLVSTEESPGDEE